MLMIKRLTVRSRNVRVATVLLALSTVTVTIVTTNVARGVDACGPVTDTIIESEQFTPYSHRLTTFPEGALISSGGTTDLSSLPIDMQTPEGEVLDELPLVVAEVQDDRQVVQYFFDQEIPTDMTMSEFLLAGGLIFGIEQLEKDSEGAVASLTTELGSRAVTAAVGNHEATLIWADPLINDIRPHHLYWSDASYLYTLVGDRAAEDLVGIGRSIACG